MTIPEKIEFTVWAEDYYRYRIDEGPLGLCLLFRHYCGLYQNITLDGEFLGGIVSRCRGIFPELFVAYCPPGRENGLWFTLNPYGITKRVMILRELREKLKTYEKV